MRFKRRSISKRLRFEILKRDEFTCQYCGACAPGVWLHVDHVVPLSAGGGNHDDNLVSACDECNLGKGPIPIGYVPSGLARKIAERAAMLDLYRAAVLYMSEVAA